MPARWTSFVRCGSSMMLESTNYLIPPYTFGTNFAFACGDFDLAEHGVALRPRRRRSFIIPLNTSFLMLTNAMYYYGGESLLNYLGDSPDNYLDKGIRELPQFWLMTTNRLQVAIIDYSAGLNNGRIVDYVQLGGMDSKQFLNSSLDENGTNSFWNTNGPQTGQSDYGRLEPNPDVGVWHREWPHADRVRRLEHDTRYPARLTT